MFNNELAEAVEKFSSLLLPISEKDLARKWMWKDHDEEGIRFAFFVTIQELSQLAVDLVVKRKLPTQAQRILGQYHKQYMDLQASIFGLSQENTERIPAEGEWPVRRVYAHILGADVFFSTTIRYALENHRAGKWMPNRMSDEDETRLVGMSEDEFTTLTRGSLEGMLAYHQAFHAKIIQEFGLITDAELELPSTFWEETRFPIRHRLHRYEAHLIQHTVQIDKTLAAIGQTPGETNRLIRYLFATLAAVESNLIGEDNFQKECQQLAKEINSRTAELWEILKNS